MVKILETNKKQVHGKAVDFDIKSVEIYNQEKAIIEAQPSKLDNIKKILEKIKISSALEGGVNEIKLKINSNDTANQIVIEGDLSNIFYFLQGSYISHKTYENVCAEINRYTIANTNVEEAKNNNETKEDSNEVNHIFNQAKNLNIIQLQELYKKLQIHLKLSSSSNNNLTAFNNVNSIFKK
jgi:5-enolpyruvylshikimate-3-phosphate synthase